MRGQALRDEVVVGVAGLHFDDFALLADVLDRVDQQQLDAAALAFRQRLEGSCERAADFALFGFHGRDWMLDAGCADAAISAD